jgi:hypothetical protein
MLDINMNESSDGRMGEKDFDQFMQLALLLAQRGYTIVSFETNGIDINLRLKTIAGFCEKSQKGD